MAVKRYAPLAGLRDAIRHYRAVRFYYDGQKYEVEPHGLGSHPVTGTIQLTAWVRRGPDDTSGWKEFHYWKIRALDVMPDTFLPRVIPRTSKAG